MSSNQGVTSRQHANTGPALPQMPQPSHAERVRTLVSQVTIATLSTLSRKHEGFPFGSLMPYALDPEGRAIFLISNMAMHTQNLKADPRASLFVAQAAEGGDPLGAARATLVGQVKPVPDPLATAASGIIAHMNADHVDAMILLARTHAGPEAAEASMTSVDRLGFYLRLRTAEGMKGTRINFQHEVRTPEETREVLVEMLRQAKALA